MNPAFSSLRFLSSPFSRILAACVPLVSPAAAQTWQDITANAGAPLNAQRGGLVSDGTRLYALGGPNGSGVLVSADGGQTFSAVNAVEGAGYSLAGGNPLNTLRFANGRVWVSGVVPGADSNYLHSLAPPAAEWQRSSTGGFPPPIQFNSFGVITDLVYDEVTQLYYCVSELGGVWVSADAQTWEQRTEGFGGNGAIASIAAIDGTVFALRPQSGGPRRTTDGGLTWTATSPHTGVDGGQLLRTGSRISFVVPGLSGTSIAYVSPDKGESWTTVPGLPHGMPNSLSGNGNLLFTSGRNSLLEPVRLLFSATAGLTWQDLPVDGLTLDLPGGAYVGVFSPSRIELHGTDLFLLGSEIINASFGVEGKLYRLDVSSFDFRAETAVVTQPVGIGRYIGDTASFSVFAVGENISYQWHKNGEPIPGATEATLDLGTLGAADAGDYTVVVTGDRGTATSGIATLEVRAERIDGQIDLHYTPEETGGGFLYRLTDGTILQGHATAPAFLARIDIDGNRLARRGLSAGLTNQQQFYPVHNLIDEAGRFIGAGYIAGSNTAANQRLRRYDPFTLEDDPTFTSPTGFDGTINGLAELPGRGYLISGNFNNIGGVPVSRLALIRYDGTVDPQFAAGMGHSPLGLVVGQDGTIYIHGTNLGGSPARRFIRLDRRGQVMTNFPAFHDAVEFMQRLNDGRILLTTTWSGNRTPVILHPDGTPDSTFNPPGAFNEAVQAVIEQPDGKLIFAGNFTSFAGNTVARHVRLLPDGAIDSTYDASAGYATGNITRALYMPEGFAYFSNSGSATFQGYSGFERGPARVFAQKADLAFVRYSGSQQGVSGETVILRAQAYGTTAVSYQWFRNDEAVSGATSATLALTDFNAAKAGSYTVQISNESGEILSEPIVLTVSGSPEILSSPEAASLLVGGNHTFTVDAEGTGTLTYQWLRNGSPISGAVSSSLVLTNLQPSNSGLYSVIVGNAFGSVETTPVALVVNTITGVRHTGFTPNPSNNTQVNKVLQRPDGVLVVSGTFATIGGGNAQRFAFLHPDTGAQVPEINRGGFNHNVNGIAVQADGKVIVGGQFTAALGSTYNRLVRLNLDGTVDPDFNPGGAGPNNPPLGVWVLRDGRILVNSGGGTYNGTPVGGLYRLLHDGTLDPSWDAGAGPTSASNIYDLAEQPDGSLVVGGAFGGFAGTANPHLVRLLPDGALDTAFNGNRPAVNYYVHAVAVQPDGRILIAGEFNNVGNANPPYLKIARLHADGSLDPSFIPTAVSSGQHIRSMQLLLNGKILLGGNFQSWPGAAPYSPNGRLVQLNPDGSLDTYFRPGSLGVPANISVNTLLALPEGKAYVGGNFTTPGNRLISITIDGTDLAITRQPLSVTADPGGTATFDVGVFSTSAETYQWYKNGQPISGATEATLTLSGLTWEDAGSYTVLVTNDSDSVTSLPATLTIGGEGPPVTFAAWPALQSLPEDKRGPYDNPTGDGVGNIIKFALGLDPAVPVGSVKTKGEVEVEGEKYLTVQFTRRIDPGDVILTVLTSSDLTYTDELGSQVVSATDNGDGTETVIVRSDVPIAAKPLQFMRLRAELP